MAAALGPISKVVVRRPEGRVGWVSRRLKAAVVVRQEMSAATRPSELSEPFAGSAKTATFDIGAVCVGAA